MPRLLLFATYVPRTLILCFDLLSLSVRFVHIHYICHSLEKFFFFLCVVCFVPFLPLEALLLLVPPCEIVGS